MGNTKTNTNETPLDNAEGTPARRDYQSPVLSRMKCVMRERGVTKEYDPSNGEMVGKVNIPAGMAALPGRICEVRNKTPDNPTGYSQTPRGKISGAYRRTAANVSDRVPYTEEDKAWIAATFESLKNTMGMKGGARELLEFAQAESKKHPNDPEYFVPVSMDQYRMKDFLRGRLVTVEPRHLDWMKKTLCRAVEHYGFADKNQDVQRPNEMAFDR